VEFEKGKTAIAVPSFDQLPKVIDTLITAVRNGELDNQIAAASTKPQKKAAKKKGSGERRSPKFYSRASQKRARKTGPGVSTGEWPGPIFPPTLTFRDFSLFVARMWAGMVNGDKNSIDWRALKRSKRKTGTVGGGMAPVFLARTLIIRLVYGRNERTYEHWGEIFTNQLSIRKRNRNVASVRFS
jgi:hypothetical protein